jgi:hypothetical protein
MEQGPFSWPPHDRCRRVRAGGVWRRVFGRHAAGEGGGGVAAGSAGGGS